MRSAVLILNILLLTGFVSVFAQNEHTITVCEGSKVFFNDLMEAPINENSSKACNAIIRTIKPGYGVEEQGNEYFIFNDVNQTYTITSKRVPSSDTEDCDAGANVEQTVKIVVEDCREVIPSYGSPAYNFFAGTYRFVSRYVNQTYCEGQEMYRYFVDESGDGELDNTYIYIVLPEKNVLLGKTGLLICEDFEKDGSCLTNFSKIEIDKEYIWMCDGCTDRTACNYKEAALKDDGSCYYADASCNNTCDVVKGCTNTTARNYNPQANCDDESCILDPTVDQIFIDYPVLNNITDYSTCANEQITVFKNQYGTLYIEVETALHQLIYNEKGDFECRSNSVDGFPCYSVNIAKAEILRTWICPNQSAITGCTDATACNYNAKAIVDDSSCFYKSANNNCFGTCYPNPREAQSGCTDVRATNYAPASACDDGSCIYQGEPTIFTRYPFLTNYIDEGSCSTEKITVYFSDAARNRIYVETVNETHVFDTNGKEICNPEDDFSYCSPEISNPVETWACGGITTFEETIRDVLITKPAFDSYYTFLYTYGSGIPTGDSFTVFAPSQEAFRKIYGDDLVKLTVGVAFNPVRSFFETINNHIVEGTYLSSDLYDGQILTSITGRALIVTINEEGIFVNDSKINEADFETSNGVVHLIDELLIAEPILLEYPWLETAVNFFRCSDEHITIYQNGETVNIYVEKAGNGTLYTASGQSFCTDESGFSCLDAYRLTSIAYNWICPSYVEPDDPEPNQPIETSVFDTFNWLDEVLNPSNCSNEKVTVYQSGTYQYLYIENENGGQLYTNYGLSFCNSTNSFSCVDAYRLTAIIDSWSCTEDGDVVSPPTPSDSELPQELKALEWLNDVIDFGNCAGASVEIFDFGSYSFVYVSQNGSTSMYLNNGTFYCENSTSFSCKSLYGINRTADVVWNCGGVNKTNLNQLSSTLQKTSPTIKYQLFPNPTSGIVYLDLTSNKNQIKQINFYDMMGKAILSQVKVDDASNLMQFNLSDQPKGLYMVELIGKNSNVFQKLVIK